MRLKDFLQLPTLHKVLAIVFVLTVSTICGIVVLIAFRILQLVTLFHVGPIAYTPHKIESFLQLRCDFLLGNKLGWSTANPKTNTIQLEASTDNSSTTTLDPHWQHATISRVGNQQLKVELFVTLTQDPSSNVIPWNIIDESDERLTAIDTKGSTLALSKKSGLLTYTSIKPYSGTNSFSAPQQEASLFTCAQ